MGYDLYGKKAISKKGEYFRNNVWWWRKLWEFSCNIAVKEKIFTKQEDVSAGWTNSGDTINNTKAKKLATELQKAINDGRAKMYEELTNSQTKTEETSMYPFTVENLQEFIDFIKDSGGFTIC